jgi:hypothetical protein
MLKPTESKKQQACVVRHKDHTVRIISTYRVKVDGKPADLHLSDNEDGKVLTYATPFATYALAVDLMKVVMDIIRMTHSPILPLRRRRAARIATIIIRQITHDPPQLSHRC